MMAIRKFFCKWFCGSEKSKAVGKKQFKLPEEVRNNTLLIDEGVLDMMLSSGYGNNKHIEETNNILNSKAQFALSFSVAFLSACSGYLFMNYRALKLTFFFLDCLFVLSNFLTALFCCFALWPRPFLSAYSRPSSYFGKGESFKLSFYEVKKWNLENLQITIDQNEESLKKRERWFRYALRMLVFSALVAFVAFVVWIYPKTVLPA